MTDVMQIVDKIKKYSPQNMYIVYINFVFCHS